MTNGELVLLFGAGGGTRAALPCRHVVETMRPLPYEPLTGVPDLVIGATLLRGRPAPVVDGAALLGVPARVPARRWIALDVGGRPVALAVAEVLGVHRLPPTSAQALPPLLLTASRAAVNAISVLDGELLVVLETARIVPDEVWRSMEEDRDLPRSGDPSEGRDAP